MKDDDSQSGGASPADRSMPDSSRILELLNLLPSFALLAGLQLEVFTHLAKSPASAIDLSRTLGVGSGRLERLLYALSAIDLLEVTGRSEDGVDRFGNGPEAARFLVAGSADFIGHERHLWSRVWSASLLTAASVRSDRPEAMLDFQSMERDDLRVFLEGLHPGALETGEELAGGWLAPCRRVLDVGGGSGGLAVALTRASAQVEVTILEVPEVAPVTRELIAAEGDADRIEVVSTAMGQEGTSHHIDQLDGDSWDAAVCKSFLQCLGPAECELTVAQLTRLLLPGGELFVIGVGILDESRTTPPHSALFDLIFLNIYTQGRSYTETEHRAWFQAAGLIDIERREMQDGTAVMRAQKPE